MWVWKSFVNLGQLKRKFDDLSPNQLRPLTPLRYDTSAEVSTTKLVVGLNGIGHSLPFLAAMLQWLKDSRDPLFPLPVKPQSQTLGWLFDSSERPCGMFVGYLYPICSQDYDSRER